MKKIGIYTHPLICNYGGILQNYALQQVLIANGFSPITFDRVPITSNLKCFVGRIKQMIFRHHKSKILYAKQIEAITKESQDFIDTHINRSRLINGSFYDIVSEIKKEEVSTVIVGSDQVWRPSSSNTSENAFLGFIPKDLGVTKISYAASFGTSTWEFSEQDTILAKEYIKDFKAVSVREESGVALCADILGVEAKVVLDPALLLEKGHYQNITNNEQVNNKGQVFSYILDKNSFKKGIEKQVTNYLGKQVFTNQPFLAQEDNWKERFSEESFKYPSISGWLDSFDKASFIITDSFHGTVFAIIFNKPFVAIGNKERGLARFETLLKLFGLESRLINSDTHDVQSIISEDIDFVSVNSKLKDLRKESINFLVKNL